MAGWLPPRGLPRVSHVPFGLVLGTDGKRFRTRSSELVRLADLLDSAVEGSMKILLERGKEADWSEEELQTAAEAVGYGALKYADLKNNRTTNYTFNEEQMLDKRGNTAVYLLYAHARICSIIRNSGKKIEDLIKACWTCGEARPDNSEGSQLHFKEPSERALALDLLRFPESVEVALAELLPSTLCEYVYGLSGSFTSFYTACQVIGSEEEVSRLLLCEAVAMVMRQCFHLLGITPLYRL